MTLTIPPSPIFHCNFLKQDVAGKPTDAEVIARGFVPIDGMEVLNTIDGLKYRRSTTLWGALGIRSRTTGGPYVDDVQFIDKNGNLIGEFDQTTSPPNQFSADLVTGYFNQQSDYSTASASDLSTGMVNGGVSAQSATAYWCSLMAEVSCSAAGSIKATIYRSVVGAPVQGAAPGGGDVALVAGTYDSPGNGIKFSIAMQVLNSNLTKGITYYFYVTIAAVGGITVTIKLGNQSSLMVLAV